MRSKDVATAADVSIRTLRHYHDLGLLPEPPRSENGYRSYSALDVARVLRIKRLASLGFSLSDIVAMDNASIDDYETTLNALDKELEHKIKELQKQRQVIAELRSEHLDPVLPLEFARAINSLYGESTLINELELSERDKAALLIASSLYSESDSKELRRLAEEAKRIGVLDKLHDIDRRVNSLSPDASSEEQDGLVAETMILLEPLLETLNPDNWSDGAEVDWSLFDNLVESEHNPAKSAVNARIEEEIAKYMKARLQKSTRKSTAQ